MARGDKAAASVHLALLRGVNVGGKNKLPMQELRLLLEELGCETVQTYIQSGNAVFRARRALSAQLATRASQAIEERFGLQVPVITRSLPELRAVCGANPFIDIGADPTELHVAFLARRPSERAIAALDPDRSPPDRLELRGREIYLHLPKGVARTKLGNAYLDATLGTTSTLRGWKTVNKLLELAEAS
jgi:uncharacterized protein (DUF1697 family)